MKKFFLLIALILIASPGYAQIPAFSVNKNGTDQTVTINTYEKLTWSNALFDTTSDFDLSNERYTPSVAGKYYFSVSAYCVNATTGCSIWLYKNGSQILTGYAGNGSTSAGAIVNINAVVEMNGTTDYVEGYINSTGNTISGQVNHAYFTGSLLDGSGTVNSGTQYQLGYYATTGDTISGHSAITTDASNNLLVTNNLGVGTASPGSKLDVKGTLRLSGATSGYVGLAPAPTAGSVTYTLPSADGTTGQVLTTNGSGTLSWTTASGSSQWITSGSDIYYNTGKVGIGTATAPAAPLYIYFNDSNFNPAIMINNPSTANNADAKIHLESQGEVAELYQNGPNLWLANKSSTGVLVLAVQNEIKGITIRHTGLVGVGTDTPTENLDVAGRVRVRTLAGATSTTVCRDGDNVLASCSSAKRFKNNVKPSALGLKEVLAMKPVTFDFKDRKENWEKHDFGFVAEDMEKISPLFTTYDGKGKIEGVRYMQLTAVNAKAIQELHALIAKQQDEIKKLKETVEQLKR